MQAMTKLLAAYEELYLAARDAERLCDALLLDAAAVEVPRIIEVRDLLKRVTTIEPAVPDPNQANIAEALAGLEGGGL